ncbi:MAG: hypothetical protein AB1638_13145 [Nitrospirota bacterium]
MGAPDGKGRQGKRSIGHMINSVKSKFLLFHLSLSFALVFATSCIQIDKAPLGEGKMIEIRHGTTANLGELRIGLGNINKSEYTNDLGEKKHGLVAMLYLFINGNPPQKKQFEVYAGRNIKMDKYSVYVQEIRGGLKGSIKLQVKKGQ